MNDENTKSVVETQAQPGKQKIQITADTGQIVGLVPRTVDEAARLSQGLAMGESMVPQLFQGKPNMVLVAILAGMEIGMPPIQALSSFCVINGRVLLWGDAIPALMQRAGHSIDVEITGTGDAIVATATLVRGDTGQKVVRTFSVEDAKKANLWGKKGPWQQYPKRMLSHRARTWVARDGAADALMGLQVSEEVQDYHRMKDVTPKQSGFMQHIEQVTNGRAGKAKAAQIMRDNMAVNQDTGPDPADENQDAAAEAGKDDASSASEAHTGDKQASTDNTPEKDDKTPTDQSDAFNEGFEAHSNGGDLRDCPYDPQTDNRTDWLIGFRSGVYEQEKEDTA